LVAVDIANVTQISIINPNLTHRQKKERKKNQLKYKSFQKINKKINKLLKSIPVGP